MTAAGPKVVETRRSMTHVYQQAVPDEAVRRPTRLLDYQYLRLLSKPRDSVAICLAIQFRSAFDPGIAQATWGELIERHPGLRLCLELPKHARTAGAGRASILENVQPPAMTIEDLRGLAADEQETRVRREFDRLSHVEWQFDRWPLHHFSLLCVGDEQLHVFFAGDHAIADALGEVLVLGEFLEIYTARLAKRPPRLAPSISAAEYDDLLVRIGRYQPAADELALVRDEMGKRPDYWNPNRRKASASERRFEVLSRALSADTTSGLLKKTVELNCSANSIVLAAFLRTMAAYPHPRKVALQLATSGTNYPDIVFDRVFAGFAQCAPTDFEVPDPDARIDDIVAAVHPQVHKRLNSGFDRALARVLADQVKKVPLEGGMVSAPVRSGSSADLPRANLHFSFLGHVRFGPAAKEVEIKRIRTGGTNPAGSLECQFLIFDDRLMLFLVFDSDYFDTPLIERFLDRFTTALETCSSPATPTAAPAAQASSPASRTGKVTEQLLEIAAETMHLEIAPDELALDLEGDLGIDSLQRVRLAIHLYSRSLKTLDRDALLACRTLAQMASVIEEHYPDGFADC